MTTTARHIDAQHGTVCRIPGERFGYFGWPSVARMRDGTLIVAGSGLRSGHVCPYGKEVILFSRDDGKTWSEPRVIQDSPIDDRDAGVCAWGDGHVLVSWFRSDTRQYRNHDRIPQAEREQWDAVFAEWTDDMVNQHLGSWVMLSSDAGATWSEPIRTPVSAPHGPIVLRDGALLYLGKRYVENWKEMRFGTITAARSNDEGHTWNELGTVPLYPGTAGGHYHEPHVVELPGGKLIGTIRVQNYEGCAKMEDMGLLPFSIMQTESEDGGATWSEPKPLRFRGSPPHLCRHTSGTLVLTYGYRQAPYGQRVALSRDDGATWNHDWILRDDGPDGDLGYPSTVELGDGSLFSVYYQKAAAGEKCSLLWSRWSLPEEGA